ncbi:DNA packaging tegument protein UL17 [Spheniscid alphaherpesvirus 1]|uniref:DNA packaging tegument protein UL17 n=1 Tax=Spheniscid alphaherpesvirus 1 TaxID=2560777 RepID=A0A1R3T8B3_9ALPH|nr:DNA packaging tegument protein UL17 [Spheniscid alphaherpesvirus 1]SCO83579.1 DNA packaging tegument protein UL17 [Spheniscid alphaherpesvirus 1]
MEAHLANETKYLLDHKQRDRTSSLIHIVIPDACLVKNGVGMQFSRTREQRLTFRTEIQVRYHGSGECTPWNNVFSGYVTSGALTSILVPSVPGHQRMFRANNDMGGLFVSLPIICDDRGRYDSFTVVVLRIIFTEREFCEMMFTYDELIPCGTRYGADASRLATLCKQFCTYVRTNRSVSRLEVVGAKLEACLNEDTSIGSSSTANIEIIDPETQMQRGGVDNPDVIARIEDEDREVMTLIRRAAEVAAKRRRVHAATRNRNLRASNDDSNCSRTGNRVVASGLLQGAKSMATLDRNGSTNRLYDSIDQAAMLAGLEAPGTGRFVRDACSASAGRPGTNSSIKTDVASVLNDTLLLVPGDPEPSGPLEWLDVGCAYLAGGDTPADAWRRRPVSMVARRHFGSGERFVVISYDGSIAWGGRRVPEDMKPEAIMPVISEACITEKVDHPRKLPEDIREKVIEEYPSMRAVLGHTVPLLSTFDVGAEIEFMGRFQSACMRALARAAITRLNEIQRLPQMIRYDFKECHNEYLASISSRTPDLLRMLIANIESEKIKDFVGSSMIISALIRIITSTTTFGYVPYCRQDSLRLIASDKCFLFDYYSTGGEIIKVSKYPIAISIDEDVRSHRQFSCQFAYESSRTSSTCERFLPGESYAYLCIGFNKNMTALIVLPGGFALDVDVAAFFEWPVNAVEPILSRLCKKIPHNC